MRACAALATLFLVAAFPATAREAAPSAAPIASPAPASAPPEAENAPDAEPAIPVPPVSPRLSEDDQYDRCMDMLADDPAGADAVASAWHGGGAAARHCHALAQIELGNPAAGAAILTSLAASGQAPAAVRAAILGQAAQAWTMAGDDGHAFETASQAIGLAPEDPDLRVIHAVAALAVHQDQAADDDLSEALDVDAKRTDALVLRATARRHLGKPQAASADVDQALTQDPQNADALLERGIMRQRAGNLAGARADWQQVEELSPETSASEMAQQDLALLDAGSRQ